MTLDPGAESIGSRIPAAGHCEFPDPESKCTPAGFCQGDACCEDGKSADAFSTMNCAILTAGARSWDEPEYVVEITRSTAFRAPEYETVC